MNVAAASQQRQRILDVLQNVQGANVASIMADVHAKPGGWTLDEQDTLPDFIRRELGT
jgi:phosphodiesterase/alkaline phosphatase D-like protein